MKTVAIDKTTVSLSDVIDRLAAGETAVVTRDGETVARIVREGEGRTVHSLIDEWFEYREAKGINAGGLTMSDYIDDGQR